ncbi:MAG: Uma2 family endonuclease [Gemmataceae bacterium]|nr:Uma2 family endonuclease [Gemmataceae bacterium]
MAATAAMRTLGDLMRRLGGVPLGRVRFRPAPGTATVRDVIDLAEREDVLCELVEGVLVEKTTGLRESRLATFLGSLILPFVLARNLGIVTGADGTMEIMPNLVRIPDLAFTSWDRMPGRRQPTEPVPELVPNLAVEVLSAGNTPGEMLTKRQDYFRAGVELGWEVDPVARTVAVYAAPVGPAILGAGDVLGGGAVLPGFALPLAQLFGELDRQG